MGISKLIESYWSKLRWFGCAGFMMLALCLPTFATTYVDSAYGGNN